MAQLSADRTAAGAAAVEIELREGERPRARIQQPSGQATIGLGTPSLPPSRRTMAFACPSPAKLPPFASLLALNIRCQLAPTQRMLRCARHAAWVQGARPCPAPGSHLAGQRRLSRQVAEHVAAYANGAGPAASQRCLRALLHRCAAPRSVQGLWSRGSQATCNGDDGKGQRLKMSQKNLTHCLAMIALRRGDAVMHLSAESSRHRCGL